MHSYELLINPNAKLLFCPMIPDIRKDIALFDRSQASLACLDNSSTKTEKSMEHCRNDSDRVLREKTVPVPLCPSNLTWTELGSKPALLYERTATNRLSHGTALQKTTL